MTTATAAITEKNFSSKLAGLIKAAKSQRDTLQSLVIFACEEYATKADKHGDIVADSSKLTRILTETVAVRSFATGTLKDYIEAHTNLKWTAKKDEKPAFRKVKGSEHFVDLDALRSTVWYLHNSDGQAKPTFDGGKYAARVAAKLVAEGVDLAEFKKMLDAAEKEARAAKAKKAKETLSAAA